MRDVVEIGMGKTALRGYHLDDIAIVPSRRTRDVDDVSTQWQLDAYPFKIPCVGHPSDATMSPASAVALGQLGGLGVLNVETSGEHRLDEDDFATMQIVADRLAAALALGRERQKLTERAALLDRLTTFGTVAACKSEWPSWCCRPSPISVVRPAVPPRRKPRQRMSPAAHARSPVRWKPNIE